MRLKDVARVVEGAEPKFGDTVVMGRWGVLMTMSSQYGANTMEVTKALEAALDEMKPVFEKEGIKLYPRLHRPATFIEAALRNMKHSLALGGILVAVVLFLLLGSVRTACISLTAIPLSLLTAVIVLEKFGITINTITLGGLAIALGEVVDDSIIDVENIFRRLRENKTLRAAAPDLHVVLSASLEVRRAVVYATFIVALIFLPVLTLTGLQGSFFAPLALSYILAILASLLVALTLTPALAFLFFDKGVRKPEEPASPALAEGRLPATCWASSPAGRAPSSLVVAVVCAGGADAAAIRQGEFPAGLPRRPFRPAGLRRARHLAAGDAADGDADLRTSCSPTRTSPPWNSRWAAPSWAKTRGDRTAASSTSSSSRCPARRRRRWPTRCATS